MPNKAYGFFRIAVNLAFFLNGFIHASWVSRLPRIQEQFGIDNGTLGLVLLTSSIGAVGAMPFTGYVIIRNGSRRITIWSIFLYCLLVPLIPLVPNLLLLILIYLLMGIATGMLDVAMNAQAVSVEKLYNKPILTSFHAFFSIGMAIGAWVGAAFTDLGWDLPEHLTTAAGIGLLTSWWISRNLTEDELIHPDQALGPLFRLPSVGLLSVGLITFCCMLGEGSMADWSVNYMENISHAGKTLAPVGLSAFATAMTLGRVFGDAARKRFGNATLIIAGGALSTAGLALALLFVTPYVTIAGFFLVGLGLSTIVPIAYSIAGNSRNMPSGVALAMVTTVGYAGFLVGPPVIGFIADWKSLRVGLLVVCFLFTLMTILGWAQRAKLKKNSI